MTSITIRIGKDPIVKIGEFNLMVEFSMDRITELGQGMDIAIGIPLGQEILETM